MSGSLYKKKLKAGVLGYVTGLSLIISMLIMLCFSINRYAYKEVAQLQHSLKLSDDMQSAITLLEHGAYTLDYNAPTNIDLEYSSTSIHADVQQWGLLDIVSLYGKRGVLTDTIVMLTGESLPANDSLSLYMADHKNYLSITGDTRLAGTCYLPRNGITKAYIEGVSYKSDTLVYGSIEQSESELPTLKSELLSRFASYFNPSSAPKRVLEADSLFVPYASEAVQFSYPQSARLTASYLGERIVITCDSTLTVANDCQLDGCIIAAPSIVIESGFRGRFQAFAKTSIVVEDSCKLLYPSVLFVATDSTRSAELRVGSKCFICGVLIAASEKNKSNLLEIGKSTIIEGQAYNKGTTDLRGEVWGELYSELFSFRTKYSRYDNLLLNVTVDKPKLSEHFVGISLFEQRTHKPAISCFLK